MTSDRLAHADRLLDEARRYRAAVAGGHDALADEHLANIRAAAGIRLERTSYTPVKETRSRRREASHG